MNINIVISGNLTGFSRFFASAEANDICKDAKFDFDYRNFLTFLSNGEKVYAISFSPKVMAVSLVTRILDSFRRPGILVVTALVPRGRYVADSFDSGDRTALYRLLNELNDKFYERNFLNGMVNQNPAVLMQDYYTEILRNYTLAGDGQQKNINANIDVAAANKRIGYVAAQEGSMSKYLSSIFRKSYNGYHSVFFGKNAPQNIDEPAEEIKTYHVRIENGNRPLAGEVRLDDRIPNVTPEQGERDIPNKNFTYRQVLEGVAAPSITATIEKGETIVIGYRFPREEKRVTFKFFENAKEIPMHLIHPVVEDSNGNRTPISTDTFTFYGREIYGAKTIRSGNPEYTIDPSSASLDLQRLSDGAVCNVYVSRGWELAYDFPKDRLKPKTLILINRNDPVQRLVFDGVTASVRQRIPGRQKDWEIEIVSDSYETIRVPAGVSGFKLTPKSQAVTGESGAVASGAVASGSRRDRAANVTNGGTNVGVSSGSGSVGKNERQIMEERRKRYLAYGIYAVLAVLACVGGYFGLKALIGGRNVIVNSDGTITHNVRFVMVGDDGKEIVSPEILEILDFELAANSDSIRVSETEDLMGRMFEYKKIHADSTVTVIVSLKGQDIRFVNKNFALSELNDEQEVKLPVRGDELYSLIQIMSGTAPADIDKQISSLQKRGQIDYAALLERETSQLSTPVEGQIAQDQQKEKETPTPKETSEKTKEDTDKTKIKDSKEKGENGEGKNNGDQTIRDGFNKSTLTIEKLNGMKHGNDAEKKRKDDLITVLGKLAKGEVPKSTADYSLSSDQMERLQIVIDRWNAIDPSKSNTKKERDNRSGLRSAFKSALKKENKDGGISLYKASLITIESLKK